ncbi:hypothetical protein FPV67DRAFT_1664041 [Lyophyllum atratum]|nr:hypothetical protein FPV67DRAFT_1672187 [Lyophyllum atratum]KAF8074882.1 hypothetical protein FPV67DRAFT_1665642 [Lyophyllum atratum]KAF8079410.1 hypothetical protein FPV67DRAFT_1664041 [Lyophyllum atratum]
MSMLQGTGQQPSPDLTPAHLNNPRPLRPSLPLIPFHLSTVIPSPLLVVPDFSPSPLRVTLCSSGLAHATLPSCIDLGQPKLYSRLLGLP